jgi:2-polyprenyl-3-methyl-5-hydroxy-6-metoxy-1,4-benzoquinol methylase
MTADAFQAQRQIERNVAIHDKLARKYDALHGEIFNNVEQLRLYSALEKARDAVRTGADPVEALDFGCGSGNLTRHLLSLGVNVTAADVSQGFLDLVRSRYAQAKTLLMNGNDLSNIADESFDLIATYSVLHHIPDYLAAVSELARVCRTGGVIMIDHEQNEAFWRGPPVYAEFQKAALRVDWRKYLTPSNYIHRVRRLFNPRHSNEGDIHVWPDDHIEWDKITGLLADYGFEVILEEDYLLFRRLYRPEVYAEYAGRCSDTKLMIFRKRSD